MLGPLESILVNLDQLTHKDQVSYQQVLFTGGWMEHRARGD